MMKNNMLVAALIAVVMVSGCTREVAKWSPEEGTPPAQVELVSHQFNIPVDHQKPKSGSKIEIDKLLNRIGADATAEIWVLSPDTKSTDLVVAMLDDLGISESQIKLTPDGSNEKPFTVTLRVDQFFLNLSKCEDWSNGNLMNASNRNSSNWGCSVEKNLALTLVNPRDLVRGRPLGLASGQTAVGAVRRYYSDKLKPLPDSNTSNFLDN